MDLVDDLRRTVKRAVVRLRDLSADAVSRPRAPGKWSPAEIIGHLIDSASNNHQRFVRARFRDDLRFDGYYQDAWVSMHRAPFGVVARAAESVDVVQPPPRTRHRDDAGGGPPKPRHDHNLDRIAWQVVPAHEPVTLEYFMRDYVAQLHHHLAQIDPSIAEDT